MIISDTICTTTYLENIHQYYNITKCIRNRSGILHIVDRTSNERSLLYMFNLIRATLDSAGGQVNDNSWSIIRRDTLPIPPHGDPMIAEIRPADDSLPWRRWPRVCV